MTLHSTNSGHRTSGEGPSDMGFAQKITVANGAKFYTPAHVGSCQQPQPIRPLEYQKRRQQYDALPQQGQNQSDCETSLSLPGAQNIDQYVQLLKAAIQQKHLQRFYPPGDPRIQQAAERAAKQIDKLTKAWCIPREIAVDIIRLALYDVVIYIDDSGSMVSEERGERIKDLELILQRVAFAATLFDEDGIEIRFMNDDYTPPSMLNNVRTEQEVCRVMVNRDCSGITPFGTKLRQKVIDGIVLPKLRQPRKPVLVIGITDGQPTGEDPFVLEDTVRYAVDSTWKLGPGAVAFQFAQVGNDKKATEFLAKLDSDPTVGGMVDCTSNYETESDEMTRAKPPVELTPDLWILKLILGAIDPSYDTQDERRVC